MKILKLSAGLIFLLALTTKAYTQLVVDAGTDTTFCEYDWQSVVLGGNPTATGGIPPYTYTWSANYFYVSQYFTASFMLNDTTQANPVLKDSPFRDTATFYLKVVDSNNDFGIDSVEIGFSTFYAELIECRAHIKSGDSIQLYHYVYGGIPPYTFYWIPEETLSDSTAEFPWAKPSSNTQYELTVTDAIGCTHPFYCNIYIDPSNINEFHESRATIALYPNPTSGYLIISIDNFSEGGQTYIEISSLAGKIHLRKSIYQSNAIINLNDTKPGLYFYRMISKEKVMQSGKIIRY